MTQYTTVHGDMWDAIAYKQLGDCSYTDALIEANPELCDIYVFEPGVVITIPDIVSAYAPSTLPPWKGGQAVTADSVNTTESTPDLLDTLAKVITELRRQLFEKQNKILANGIVKGDGTGNLSAATAGTDYQLPLTAGANISISDNVISAVMSEHSHLMSDITGLVAALAELNALAKNANIALGVANYSALCTMLNGATAETYKVGQSIYVQTLNVPDVWIYSVESSSVQYTYTTDAALTAALQLAPVQIGFYKISMLETQKVDLANYRTSAAQDAIDNGKQSKVTASGLLKGDGDGGVSAATAGVDFAPAYAPFTTLTSAETLSTAYLGKYIMANGSFTIIMPTATIDMSGAEMEIHNVGTGTITLTGAFMLGGTAYATKSVTFAADEAVTVKCIGTGSGAWTIIGAFTEV